MDGVEIKMMDSFSTIEITMVGIVDVMMNISSLSVISQLIIIIHQARHNTQRENGVGDRLCLHLIIHVLVNVCHPATMDINARSKVLHQTIDLLLPVEVLDQYFQHHLHVVV